MNSEYAINSIKTLLETYLPAMIAIVEGEASSTYSAPLPQQYFFGDREVDIMTLFPSIQISGKSSGVADDEYGEQERILRFEIVSWIIEEDVEKLNRYVLRYADSIIRCIRKESYWSANLHSPIALDAVYSGLYQTDFGLAKGCLVTGSINYFIN